MTMKTCHLCGGPLRRRRIEHMHERGGQRFLIRNLSAEVCAQCGEAFLAPATLRAVDQLVAVKKPDGHISIAVYEMKSRAA